MTITDAIKVLDDVIPPPHDKMVDTEHFQIAEAWSVVKKALLDEAATITAKLPVGMHVHAKRDLGAGVTPGMLGRVEGCTDDGRLRVFWHNCYKCDVHSDDVEVASERG